VRDADRSFSSLAFGVAFSPIEGETVCGDRHLVVPRDDGYLVGVLDGLGHGAEAAAAADAAIGVLVSYVNDSVSALPPLRSKPVNLMPGDALIMATDGIQPDFADGIGRQMPSQRLAEGLLGKYRKGNDDALVLVVHYQPGTNAR
jgi:serine phosphatase RsbU (regulator of sigma subunit)